MNLRQGVMRGAFSLGSARVASNLLNAAAILILARLLTPEDFGIVAIAMAVLTVVQSATELSLNNALIQKDKVERSHIDTAWTMALIRAAIIVAFFVLAAWPLSMIYSRPDMVPVFIVSGVTGAMIGLQNPHIWLETKSMRFFPLALVQFAYKGFGVFVAIGLASRWNPTGRLSRVMRSAHWAQACSVISSSHIVRGSRSSTGARSGPFRAGCFSTSCSRRSTGASTS